PPPAAPVPLSVTINCFRSGATCTPLGFEVPPLWRGTGIVPINVLVLVSMTSTALLGRSAEYIICLTGSKDKRSKLAFVSNGGGGVGLVVIAQFGIGISAIKLICDAWVDVKAEKKTIKAKANAQ